MVSALAERLVTWYDQHRRFLPWREDPTPYHVWVSEIMLQQTRVEAVKGYYTRFLTFLPDVYALAEADEGFLLKLWQGLGYYSRARNLQKAAKQLVQEQQGQLPDTTEELQRLPGIGAYTAGAIASIAFGKPVIAPDGNAYRIFSRLQQEEGFLEDRETKKRLEEAMQSVIDHKRPGAFNQALMDLGSLICLAKGDPLCAQCPLHEFCAVAGKEIATQYPKRRPKKPRRKEKKTVLLIQQGDRLLLWQQPKNDLLAGMWLFPMLNGHLSPEEILMRMSEQGIARECIQQIEGLDPAIHIFSHLEWHMIGYLVILTESKYPILVTLGNDKQQDSLLTQAEAVQEEMETVPEGKKMVWANPEEIARHYAIPTAHRPFFVER
ncbi:A/G-specific adenine glycosylase [Murdochiella massiliensis]|uniref:A/G-specific adenine glycosylase n=1 Tax=Murdochiella massiliensis TaxID=1673723 RepID=UPI00082A24DF|nr:A/G-specific adenine glycosylase [Murdochiella massiliensis]